ncbi:MAG TPA: ECF-type sigma factor [Burkholderiales bacterium]|nr:ECF-type sigma factor [Burkholderiales bacterium]
MCPDDANVEKALAGWRQGDQGAVDDLFRLVYDELRVLAGRHLRRRRPGDTLGPTALVHEVYLRFAQRSSPDLVDRHHFVALAARAMRMVIVDHWRRKQSQKRGPQAPGSASPEDVAAPDALPPIDVLALDEALRSLSELDARQAQVVELRFFGGLTLDEIAAMFGVSERTVKREWQQARAFLYHAMHSPGDTGDA